MGIVPKEGWFYMLSITILFFRELLEVFLVVAVMCSATNNLPGRNYSLNMGIALGVVMSITAFLCITYAANLVNNQVLLEVTLLILAAITIAWSAIWMIKNRDYFDYNPCSCDGGAVVATYSGVSCTSLCFIVALSILREGVELTLVAKAIMIADHLSMFTLFCGASIGVIAGIITSYVVYNGLMKLPIRGVVTATGWAFVCIASYMVMHAIERLNEVGSLSFV
jgi:high-affinity iron transporter